MADTTAPSIGGQPEGDERRREGLRRREHRERERKTENEMEGEE